MQELSADFLAGIIERVAHPIFVKDRRYRFVLVNRALCEMVGYDRTQLLGKTDYDFFPRQEADFFRQADEQVLATGAAVTLDEEPITDAEGRVHFLATTKVPWPDEAGRISHLVGIIHDITDLKLTQDRLRDAKSELEQRVAERTAELAAAQERLIRADRLSVLGQLAGGLAHQLRNPLGTIQNAAALLRKGELPSNLVRAIDIIEEEVRRADLIIRNLLDYARIRPPTRREVLLRELVDETLAQAAPPASVDVVTTVDEHAAAHVDPLQLQTALGNIVRNAIEAMPQGGRLEVAARCSDGVVTIRIRDSGGGVRPEAQGRLFDPLHTTKPTGSGLGLSTARNLVENHGGTIHYVDAPGGAEFVLELPADEPADGRA